MDLSQNPFEDLAKDTERNGLGNPHKLASAQIRAQGFQANITDEIRFALSCLNSELARLDKTIGDVTSLHGENIRHELLELHSKALPEVAEKIRESSHNIQNLSQAISNFSGDNVKVLTDRLTKLVDVIQKESCAAGKLTKWLIGTSIAAILVNVLICFFTAVMALKTDSRLEITDESLRRQAQIDGVPMHKRFTNSQFAVSDYPLTSTVMKVRRLVNRDAVRGIAPLQ